MSIAKPLLNAWLRRVERPFLAKAQDFDKIRTRLERMARFLFFTPRAVTTKTGTIGGRPALEIVRKGASDSRIILYFHGGAYVFGSPATHAAMVGKICVESQSRAILQNYRKAPDAPFPAAVQDAEAAWLELLARGEDPSQIFIGGDSAGGGLALALLSVLMAKGYPLPAGVFAFSPLTDMTFSGQSVASNADRDVMLPADRVHEMAQIYLAGRDPNDPTASPLWADFSGAPPIWLVAGDTEILLDDTRRLVTRLREQGVRVMDQIEHDLPHVWPLFHNSLPEARITIRRLGRWITQLTGPQAES